jgi:hypothetical protein
MADLRRKETGGMQTLGVGLTILGLAVALVLFRKSRERVRPRFARRSLRILEGARNSVPNEVQILYNNRLVPRLVKTYMAFWNQGTKTLNKIDVVDSDRLRIELLDGELLRARVVAKTREVNGFVAEIGSQGCTVRFDFLDKGDGGVIELLHTGSETELVVHGTIKGVPDGIRYRGLLPPLPYSEEDPWPVRIVRRSFPKMLIIIAAAGLLITIIGALGIGVQHPTIGSRLGLGFLGILYLLPPVAWLILMSRTPRALRLDSEDVQG